jgi:hypothetical protein
MKPKTETTTASLAVVGVDIGKEVFHLVGLGTDGTIAFRRKIRRLSLKDVFERLPACVVGMEACLSAHFGQQDVAGSWSRAADYPGHLYQTLREGAEERLQRC